MPTPQELAEQDRLRAIAQGDQLNQQAQDRMNAGTNYENQYRDYTSGLYMGDAEGAGGYNPQEQQDIMGREGLQNMQMTEAERQGAYLTPEEQAGVRGDPYSQMDYYRPDYLNSMQMGAESNQRAAAGGLQSGLNAAVNPNALRQREDYRGEGAQTLNEGDTAIQQGIEGSEAAVRAGIDRNLLAQNPELAGNYRMSDAEKQDIITGAGITEGQGYRAAMDSTERAARAAGTNPLGVAAARARTEQASRGAGADAMTQARIKADAEQAGRELTLEQNRQGTEQYISGATTSNEQALAQRRLNAQNEAMGRRLGFMSDTEKMRLGAEQGLSDRQIRAASEGGQAALKTEGDIQRQQQQVGQYNIDTGMEGARTSEQSQQQREAGLASNRQAQQNRLADTRYDQERYGNEATSNRAQQVGDTRLQQQKQGRDYFSGLQTQQNQNVQNEANRQSNIYGTQVGGANQSTGNAVNAKAVEAGTPKWWEKALGAGVSAVGAFFDRGGVVTEPTIGTVGEQGPEYVGPVGGGPGGQVVSQPTTAMLGASGPEAVVPMNNAPNNYTRPSVAYGREQIRKQQPPAYQPRRIYG